MAHGGDLDAARALFPGAPEPWIDLSMGINPVPYSLPALDASLWHRLPSAADARALRAAAAEAYGAPGLDCVVPAPGTQVLIEILPRLVGPTRVAVVGPTYAEHEAAWTRGGHAVRGVTDLAEAAEATVAVVVNPNNPDGRVHEARDLLAMARDLAGRGGLLVVDEAFCDLEPAGSLAGHLAPGLVVLRSFGKTYGLAGLRLGFALALPEAARAIGAALGPWAVSGPALAVGRAALADRDWLVRTAAERAADAGRLDRMLARAGCAVVGGTSLFRLARCPDAPALFHRLGAAGIFVRRFAEQPDLLRFGLPAGKDQWCRLSRVLKPSAALGEGKDEGGS